MKIFFLIVTILNMILISASELDEGYPLDTSEDIFTEGISDPGYIVKSE